MSQSIHLFTNRWTIAAAILLLGGGYWISKRVTLDRVAYAAIRVEPFTMEQLTTADGKPIESRTTARAADGSEVWIGRQLERPELGVMRKSILSDGRATTAIDRMSAKMSGFLDSKRRAARNTSLTNPPANCAYPHETIVRRETLAGEEAVVVRSDESSLTTVDWRLPKFSCVRAASMIEVKDTATGSIKKKVEVKLVYFVRGEPGNALFTAGVSYQEMKPSELKSKADREIAPSECPTCVKPPLSAEAKIRQADEKYLSMQTPD